MEFALHWEVRTNFINQEVGASSKIRLGCKPNNLSQRTYMSTKINKLGKGLKKEIEAQLLKHKDLVRKDTRALVYINNTQYTLNCRNAKQFSNDLVNQMLRDKHLKRANMDYIISKGNIATNNKTN